ncbi:MAG: T9SS type A sorting domain-containing protein [Chitinophagaceae bacterium]
MRVFTHLIMAALLLTAITSYSQSLYIGPGATLYTTSNATGGAVITISNGNLVNEGIASFEKAQVYIKGTGNYSIQSKQGLTFKQLIIDKDPDASVLLRGTINISEKLMMQHGMLNLNGNDVYLASSAIIEGESLTSHITGANGGKVQIIANLNNPAAVNPGNLGVYITSTQNLGQVTIARGHDVQSGTGFTSSIKRYYNINTTATNLDVSLKLSYFEDELNGIDEGSMLLYNFSYTIGKWSQQKINGKNTTQNYVEAYGLASLDRFTLVPESSTLPVTGLQFTAKRVNNSTVQLHWKTVQEMNNQGFYIERKMGNETGFTNVGFQSSLADNGNSNTPLDYLKTDDNNYNGITYYRLKQVDIDGKFTYSPERTVSGNNATASLKVWPNPARGYFNVQAEGIDKDVLLLYDASGKLIRKITVTGNTVQQVQNVQAGIYILSSLSRPEVQQKVVVL